MQRCASPPPDRAGAARGRTAATPQARVAAWVESAGEDLDHWQRSSRDMRAAGAGDFATLTVGVESVRIARRLKLCRADNPVPGKLILVRHGQSIWNVENLFTGWTDVDLSDAGLRGGGPGRPRAARRRSCTIDIVFTSVLKRAIRTQWIMLDEIDRCGCRSSAAGGSTSATTARCRD